MPKIKTATSNKSKSNEAGIRVRRANTSPKLSKNSPTMTNARSSKSAVGEQQVTIDRRRSSGRRQKDDESALSSSRKHGKIRTPKGDRSEAKPSTSDHPALERREKVSRRRQIDPTTCERDYTEAEIEFMNALDDYKRKNGRMFPTCSEVLEVIRMLGYVQLTPADQVARNTPETDLAAEISTDPHIQTDLEYEAQDSNVLTEAILPGESIQPVS